MHLRGRPVDFVGEQHGREDRPAVNLEAPLARDEDQRSDQVARQQIGRELDATEAQAERLRERAHRRGLREPRHAVDEGVTTGEQGHEQTLEQRALSDDDAAHLVEDPLEFGARSFHLRASGCARAAAWSGFPAVRGG